MVFFELFKRKKLVEDIKIETNNVNCIGKGIKVGQKLFCKNGETVIVCEIKDKTLTVEYKFNKYERGIEVIGKTLFISNPNVDNNDLHRMQQEEERRLQEQIKITKKQEEEYCQKEQIELQMKQEEECRRKEQLELQRRRGELLELKKKQEEERVRQEQLRLETIREIDLSIGEFKKNETHLYHNVFGEGVFIEFDSKKEYIFVKFNNKKQNATFVFPDAIGKYLFIQKTEKILKREEFLQNSEYKKEDFEEQKYFDHVCKIVDEYLRSAYDEENTMIYGYNDFSDSFDSSVFHKHQLSLSKVTLYSDIRNNPYFARVDYGEKEKFYIGKNAIEGLVIDWRDKICNLYYQYNIYIGNFNYNLSLVRDFEIISGMYCGFFDKYSRKDAYEIQNIEKNVILDEFLIKIISANRGNKKTHDIIQTIQRNQYEIITCDKSQNMLVLGCAGSGKTMIMFHRLSYMIFNHQEIDIKKIYIISPTKLLNLESDELSRALKINAANRFALNSFNTTIIKQYYDINKAYNINNFEKVKSNALIDSVFIKYIYSNVFINGFKRDVYAIFSPENKKRMKFIELEEIRLLNEYKDFCKEGEEFNDISVAYNMNEYLNNVYENAKKAVSRLPLQNALEKITKINETLRLSNTNDKSLKRKREVLQKLVDNWEMSNRVIYIRKNKRDEISIDDKIFNEVFGFFNVLGRGNINNKDIIDQFPHLKGKFLSTSQMLNEYNNMIEKLRRFNDFKMLNNYDYLSEVINQLIIDIKHDNQIDIQSTYEFEVFLHLIGCNVLFNKLHVESAHIFIDEFQDCAFTELAIYKEIFPNAIFNLFGDVKQSINDKGLNKRDIKQIIDGNWKTFNINENYRNAHQITEHINSEFNLNMMPIGVNGSVEYYNINDLTIHIGSETSDRIAFIVKDIDLYERIRTNKLITEEDNEKINIITNDECLIKNGTLNIIPINLAKGLEFEQVYVVPDQMTENEIYVAYTRALNRLCILKLDPLDAVRHELYS